MTLEFFFVAFIVLFAVVGYLVGNRFHRDK